MLIYNHQKEFLGIDESDLKILGFLDLLQLRGESADFADLFVKTPGYIHNFQHVHWIDFVLCAEDNEDSKVIIHTNGKNFRCTLEIKTLYLMDNPSQKAYFINLVNLKEFSLNDNEQVATDIDDKPIPKVSKEDTITFNTPEPTPIKEEVHEEPKEKQFFIESQQIDSAPPIVEDTPIDLGEDFLSDNQKMIATEVDEPKKFNDENLKIVEEVKENITPVVTQILNVGIDYKYDPHIASDELGLPIDLIEEFIEDFIAQANDFKDELYKSLEEDDITSVKTLSHKLKGVAANLRVEDAYEVLATINTSDNSDVIKLNMDTLYIIIEKLAKHTFEIIKQVKIADTIQKSEETSIDNDDLILSFKDDVEKEIEESNDSQDIEMLNLDTDAKSTQDNLQSSYNKTLAAEEIGIDAQSFDKLFKDYIKEANTICNDINDSIKQDNSELWKKNTSRLKGMSANMRIHDFTKEFESIINTKDSNTAKTAIDILSAKLKQMQN